MRPARLISGIVLVLAGAMVGHAQTPPYTAAVKTPEAEVRSGPSADAKMYITNKLRRGEMVQVVKTRDDGWLEIKPPAGSFSWINQRLVQQANQDGLTFVVLGDPDSPIPVRIGSNVVNEKPTVEGARVSRGSLVVAIGKPMDADDGVWLPIEPPPSEVRFIRADAVGQANGSEPPMTGPATISPTPIGGSAAPAPSFDGGAGPATVAPPPAPGVSVGGSGGSGTSTTTTTSNSNQPTGGGFTPIPAPTPGSPEAMWMQAQQAEQTGNTAQAEQLYTRLAHAVCQVNHDLAMRCYNRIQHMKDKVKNSAVVGQLTSKFNDIRNQGQGNRIAPTPTDANGAPLNYVTTYPGTSQSQYPSATLAPQCVGPGLLRVAGRPINAQRAYVLQDSEGRILMYVTPQQGVDLEGYVNRVVSLFGPMVYNGDLRANYMTVQRVTPAQ